MLTASHYFHPITSIVCLEESKIMHAYLLGSYFKMSKN